MLVNKTVVSHHISIDKPYVVNDNYEKNTIKI